LPEEEVMAFAKELGAPYELLMQTVNWDGYRSLILPPVALPPLPMLL
jgi:hypothetical protein